MASTKLTKTFASDSNRKTWTWSGWIKRSGLGGIQTLMTQVDGWSGNGNAGFYIIGDQLTSYNLTASLNSGTDSYNRPSRYLRDVNGFYHIVVRLDTTQSTASNRCRWYVNGEQLTDFVYANYPSLNQDCNFNGGDPHGIGSHTTGTGNYFDGIMSHVHFADGQSLEPTVFGSTDSTTGEWTININPTFTLGTHGFTILKDGNTITDQSSNSNDWSLSGGTLTKTEDCPDNVFATWNPLGALSTPPTFSNGNTTAAIPNSGGVFRSTLAASSGKYYCEVKVTSLNAALIGIQPIDSAYNASIFSDTSAIGIYGTGGEIYKNGSNLGGVASVTDNDIIGMAIDLDNNNIYFSKNGQYASGISGSWNQTFGSAYAVAINSGHTYTIASQNGGSGTSSNISINFGNGYFATTAVSSAGINASGNGIFEYDVPTGYTALSTKGLNL